MLLDHYRVGHPPKFRQVPQCFRGTPSYPRLPGKHGLSFVATSGGRVLGPKIIAHSIGMILLLRNVTVPPSTGNFSIPCAVDVECPSSPIFTSKDIWPSGQMVSPLNPVRSPLCVCSSPSMYIVQRMPSLSSASMIIVPLRSSLVSTEVGKDIVVSGEKLRVGYPMHESGDLHAFRCSFHVQDFFFVSLHEILRGLSIPLLDVMYLYWILNVFLNDALRSS
ncbi:hypothetical protein Tco_1500514 [Tanacetum coccineum]